MKRAPWTALVVLAAVVAASGWVRAVHADFGLPHRWHPDETRAASDVVALSRGARTLPRYQHPPLLKLLAAAAVVVWERLARFDSQRDAVVALRGVSVVAGTLTVLLLYLVARRFLAPGWSLAAAAIYAVFPIAVVQSKYGVPDALMSALFLAGLWTQMRLYEKPSAARYLIAGFVVTLAVAAKYNAVFLVASLLTAHFLAEAKHDPALGRYPLVRMAAACAAGAAIGFLAGFPFVPFGDLGVLLDSTVRESHHLLSEGHTGITVAGLDYGYAYYFVEAIAPAAGPLLLVAIVAGLVTIAMRREPPGLVAIAALVPYYVAIEYAYKVPPCPERYVLPLVALYVLAAVVAAAALVERLTASAGRLRRDALVAGATMMLMAWPAWRTTHIVAAMEPDTRETMRSWIEAHVPHGSVIASHRSDLPFYYPPLSQQHYAVIGTPDIEEASAHADYVLASSLVYQRYLDYPDDAPAVTDFYRRLRRPEDLVHAVSDPEGRYMFQNPTLELYRVPDAAEHRDHDGE